MQEMNPDYRYQKLWLAIGYTLVMLVVYYSVITNPPAPGAGITKVYKAVHLQAYFDKSNHLLAYFVLMAWFAQIYHVRKQRIICALSFISLGVTLELIQSLEPGRKLELADMVANSSGVMVAYLVTRLSVFRLMLLRVESYI